MSHPEILHFSPPPRPEDPANNPAGAESARQKIAELPDAYDKTPAPSKEELASWANPVSPVADEQSITSSLPDVGGFVLRSSGNAAATTEAPTRSKPLSVPSRLKPLIVGVVTFLLLFTIFKSPILLSQLNYLTQKKTPPPASAGTAAVGPDPVLIIPKINVNAPIVFAKNNVESSIQHDLESGVVHYANTAMPGENGNDVIFGHSSNDWWEPGNYKFVFVLLDKLVPGDTMTINYNSKPYLYKVTNVQVVEPTNVGVLAPTPDATLTIITCTPPGTSWKRLIVTAKQVTPAEKSAQTATKTPTGTFLPSNSKSFSEQLSSFWQGLGSIFSGKPKDQTTSSPNTIPVVK